MLAIAGQSTSDATQTSFQFDDNGTSDHLWMMEPANDPQLSYDDFTDQEHESKWAPA